MLFTKTMAIYMVAVFVCLGVFASGSNVEIEKCAWGESYWCSDLRIAKTCGAFQHCKMTVWKNQELPVDSSEVCEFCQAIVADVHKFISENKTKDDIARFVSSACGMIPNTKVADECKLIVQQYLPELIDLIVAELNPQVVCSLLKLCTGLEDKVEHSAVVSSPELHHVALEKNVQGMDSEICNDCKKFINDIRAWLTSKEYEAEVEKMIDENICPYFGAFQSECKDLVKQYLPIVLKAVADYYDPNVICQPFCTTSANPALQLSLFNAMNKMKSAEGCLLCKTVITELQALDRDPKIQAQIISFLKTDVCQRMGSMNGTCSAMIDRFAPSFFELLATLLEADARCQQFGFCPGSSSTDNVIQMVAPKIEDKTPVKISPECVLCEFIMKELDDLLSKNATEVEIIAALDKVCSLLPSTIKQSCLDFVNTYGPAIIALLKQELDPAQVCTFLGMCTSGDVAPVQVKASNDELCLVCETIVQYVEAMLEQNATVTEIETLVKKVCNFLPDTMKTQCVQIVDKYGPIIVHLIATELSPKEVCTLAKLCTGSSSSSSVHMLKLIPAKPRVGGTQCSYGPSYWCASQQNAEQCGAVEHCKRYVWNN